MSQIDVAAAARGASRGFTILLLGGLSVPLVATWLPALASVWLTLSAVLAFTAAAWNVGTSPWPSGQGSFSAVFACVLVLPLVLMTSSNPSVVQLLATAGAAVVVGALVGWLRHRRQGSR